MQKVKSMDNRRLSVIQRSVIIIDFIFELHTIDWNTISAVATCFEVIIVFIPAVFFFVYYKVNYLDWWIYDQNQNGMKVVLHNKSKSSIFVLKQTIQVKNNETREYTIPLISNSEINSIQIKPDDFIVLNIDFGLYDISHDCDVILYLEFGGKGKRIIKLHKKYK